jgi:hypothetical protein
MARGFGINGCQMKKVVNLMILDDLMGNDGKNSEVTNSKMEFLHVF